MSTRPKTRRRLIVAALATCVLGVFALGIAYEHEFRVYQHLSRLRDEPDLFFEHLDAVETTPERHALEKFLDEDTGELALLDAIVRRALELPSKSEQLASPALHRIPSPSRLTWRPGKRAPFEKRHARDWRQISKAWMHDPVLLGTASEGLEYSFARHSDARVLPTRSFRRTSFSQCWRTRKTSSSSVRSLLDSTNVARFVRTHSRRSARPTDRVAIEPLCCALDSEDFLLRQRVTLWNAWCAPRVLDRNPVHAHAVVRFGTTDFERRCAYAVGFAVAKEEPPGGSDRCRDHQRRN